MKKTRFVLLGLLQEESLSGYEMKKAIDIRMPFFWQESFGQIYPELARMAGEGLVEADKDQEDTGRGREKTRYKLTDPGRRELKRWMVQENEKDSVRSEFLLKMYLSTPDNEEEMRRHIKTFREQSEEKLKLFRLFQAELIRIADDHGNHRQILRVLNLGIRQAELYIEWCDEMLQECI